MFVSQSCLCNQSGAIKSDQLVSSLSVYENHCLSASFTQPIKSTFLHLYCQALSISQSLNLSLSLRDRDRADTIITLYHTTPPTENFLSTLELTYTQV